MEPPKTNTHHVGDYGTFWARAGQAVGGGSLVKVDQNPSYFEGE